MANNDFKVRLGAIIDESSLTDVQKQLVKTKLEMNADLKLDNFAKTKKEIENQINDLARQIKNILGSAVTDKQANQWAKQYYDASIAGAKQAVKEQEKLNDAQRANNLAEQEKYYKRIIDNTKQIYALKEKMLTADKAETKELQRQIRNAEKRNTRAYESISKNGLGSTDYGLQVDSTKRELENRLAIKQARLNDKQTARETAEIDKRAAQERLELERQIAEYNKQELEYQKQRQEAIAKRDKEAIDEESLRQSIEYYNQEQQYQQTRAKYLAEGKVQQDEYNAKVKDTVAYYKQFADEADKAFTASQKLAKQQQSEVDAIEQVRLKTIESREAEEQRQRAIADKAKNDSLREEYELRQKIAVQNANQVSGIQTAFDDTGKTSYNNQIKQIIESYRTLGMSEEMARQRVDDLKRAHSELGIVLNTEESVFGSLEKKNVAVIEANERYVTELNKTTNALKQQTLENRNLATTQQRLTLANRIQKWADSNTKAMSEYGEEVSELIARLTNLDNTMDKLELSDIRTAFTGIDTNARQTGMLGFSTLDKFKNALEKFGGWSLVTGGITQVTELFRDMVTSVIEVDSAMVELSKVSDASANDIKNYFDTAAESAKELGASVSDVISATADFSRLGYDLPDASELSEVATLYKNVGDGIDIDTASSSIVSTMKAFGVEASDAMEIVDKFNEVGNNFAISSGGIGDALSRSASSLAVANNSLSESIGLITAANTVVQDTSTVGTALKSVSLRMTSTSAELEELGEDTEYACETLSDYRDLVMGLTHNQVDILGDDGEYKSTYEMLSDISDVWQEMNSMEQSSLMKSLFGVRQANIGASILENFDIAREAMEAAEQSSGSALAEQEAYSQGIQYSLDRLTASFQEISNTMINSGLLKWFVDFGNGAVNALNSVFEGFNNINTAVSSLGGLLGEGNSIGGSLGALSGLAMSLTGVGKHVLCPLL